MPNLTLEDIAKQAGVSRSTVSRVVNDNPNVSDKVRARVQQVIQSTDYHPHAAARDERPIPVAHGRREADLACSDQRLRWRTIQLRGFVRHTGSDFWFNGPGNRESASQTIGECDGNTLGSHSVRRTTRKI